MQRKQRGWPNAKTRGVDAARRTPHPPAPAVVHRRVRHPLADALRQQIGVGVSLALLSPFVKSGAIRVGAIRGVQSRLPARCHLQRLFVFDRPLWSGRNDLAPPTFFMQIASAWEMCFSTILTEMLQWTAICG